MLSWLFGFLTMGVFVYFGMAIATWFDNDVVTCWYCRILKALAWPYEVWRAFKY